MKSQLENFERKMSDIQNWFVDRILNIVLSLADFCVTNFRSKTSCEKAKLFKSITEHMYFEMKAEVHIRARLYGEQESDGLPEVREYETSR